MFSFRITSQDGGGARCGVLETPHGAVETPVFMPVGTRGSIKGILPEQLGQTQTQMILANTYHLLLRPGPEVVAALGGLHRFMGWDGPILTDSGGFQVFSLESLNRITDEEVEFTSHIDGARIRLTPESATRIQNQLGADIIMAFDQCVKLPSEPAALRQAVDRTLRWAGLCRQAHQRTDQWMFGIVQGGTDPALRRFCTEKLAAMDFPGYAIGGLSVGETHDQMIATVRCCTELLPAEKPRYLMGVGMPQDITAAIGAGVDMFDCVLPTRNGRHSVAFTQKGLIRLRNQCHQVDRGPLDPGCDCYTCRNFSRGYLRHLFMVGEATGAILVSLHNLSFFQCLVAEARRAIRENRYNAWAHQWAEYHLDRAESSS
jgi:queuine tRNA-ribosyltransferase